MVVTKVMIYQWSACYGNKGTCDHVSTAIRGRRSLAGKPGAIDVYPMRILVHISSYTL